MNEVWYPPQSTKVTNLSLGIDSVLHCPLHLFPNNSTLPSFYNIQEWNNPHETWITTLLFLEEWMCAIVHWPYSFYPKNYADPSSNNTPVWSPPHETCLIFVWFMYYCLFVKLGSVFKLLHWPYLFDPNNSNLPFILITPECCPPHEISNADLDDVDDSSIYLL